MDAHTQSIYQIFDSGVTITVPFFQRSYVWGHEEWERLLVDMSELCKQEKPYFLGAIILKRLNKEGKQKSIVDGQQRLTTLLILLKILSLDEEESKYEFIIHFTNKNGKNKDIKYIHSYYDREAFEKVFNLNDLTDIEGNNRIIEAYYYFKEKYKEYNLDYYTIVSNICMVDIEIDSDENEQQIFETINSVGCKLTTAELLKNLIFKQDDVDKYQKIWVPTFENDEECISYWDSVITAGRTKRSNTESFFHAFLQIKMQSAEYNLKAEEKAIFRKADNVFNNYKTFIGKYVKEIIPFTMELTSYASIYRKSFEVDCTKKHIFAEPSIERINFIIYSFDATTLIPYVLYILRNADKAEITKIFDLLESYIIRRVICKENNDNYSDMFNENLIAKGIKTYNELLEYIDSRRFSSLLMPNDEMVIDAFRKVKLNNKQAKAILYLLESKLRGKKYSTCLSECSKYELEHLMPKKWQANWKLGNGVSELERNKAINCIGNMMIISDSLNSSISNADWLTKKNGTKRHKGLLKYASDLEIWNDVLSLSEWNENSIFERAAWLADQANEVWNNDCSEDVKSPKNKSDNSQYSIDGKTFLCKARFVPYLIKKYLEINSTVTIAQLKNLFPDSLLLAGHKRCGLIVTEEDLKASDKSDLQKRKWYYANDPSFCLTSGDNIRFFVNNQWTKDSIQSIIKVANSKGLQVIVKDES